MVHRFQCSLASLFVPLSILVFGVSGCGAQVERASVCTPHARELCYGGPAETEGVGHCRAGLRTCAEDGSGFGPCMGEVLPVPEVCGASGDMNCDGKAGACTGNTVWGKRFPVLMGYGGTDSISVDGLGNVALGLGFYGDLDLGAPIGVLKSQTESGASCVLKMNSAGEPIFATLMDGTFALSIASDTSGNTMAIGNFQQPMTISGQTFTPDGSANALLFSLDSKGNLNFGNHVRGTGYLIMSPLDTNATGDIVIGGSASGSVDLSADELAGDTIAGDFIGRFDSSGAFVFGKQLPSVLLGTTQFDGHGNIFLGGYLYDEANFGGDTLKSVGQMDFFVVKLGPTGEHVWSKRFGSSGINHSSYFTIAPDSAGNVYMAGTFSDTWDFGGGPVTSTAPEGSADGFLVKLDSFGNYLWGKYFGSGDNQEFYSLAVDASGNAIIAGRFSGSIDFGTGMLYTASSLVPDIAVAKFSPYGDAIWSKRYGMGNNIYNSALAVGPSGEVFLAGNVAGDIDFGSGTLPAKTYGDEFYVVKLEP